MRELQPAGQPWSEPERMRVGGLGRVSLSRTAFAASVVVHVIVGYALSRHTWTDSPTPPRALAEFFLFETVPPPPRERALPPEEPPAETREVPQPVPTPARPPAPTVERAVESPPPVETREQAEPTPPAPTPAPRIDFEEARQRAAEEVIAEREADSPYMTFSIDDVAPPRPIEEPERRSIFDGGGGTRGPSVGQVGQARTPVGRRLSELCNALTGGFSLMGFGSFCARGDEEPSGLFPELRPAYLDLMPECVETRPDTVEPSPFPTVKCRLVKREDAETEP
jgi:hypothetical protein